MQMMVILVLPGLCFTTYRSEKYIWEAIDYIRLTTGDPQSKQLIETQLEDKISQLSHLNYSISSSE